MKIMKGKKSPTNVPHPGIKVAVAPFLLLCSPFVSLTRFLVAPFSVPFRNQYSQQDTKPSIDVKDPSSALVAGYAPVITKTKHTKGGSKEPNSGSTSITNQPLVVLVPFHNVGTRDSARCCWIVTRKTMNKAKGHPRK